MLKFKRIIRYARTFEEILVEIDGDVPPISGTALRAAAVKYAEEQMEGYEYNKIIDNDCDGIKILMEKKK